MPHLIVFISFFITSPLIACSVCGFGDDSRNAFISTTALMTFVPLIMIGALAFWVHRRFKHAEELSHIDKGHAGISASSKYLSSDSEK
jgi:hypothetical protein